MRIIFIFIALLFFATFNYSCKKNNANPPSILGKWYFLKQNSQLLYNGVLLETITKTKFTINDFIEYYKDGSGYYSLTTATSPSLTEFTYSISGNTLTIYSGSNTASVPETITGLQTNTLAIHTELKVPDPNVFGQYDDEIDDVNFTRAN